MEISVRKAVLADTEPIANILTTAVQFKLGHNDMSWGEGAYSEREVRGLIKTNATYVVEANGGIIGTFGLHWDDERIWGDQPANAGYIHRLAIRKDMHG